MYATFLLGTVCEDSIHDHHPLPFWPSGGGVCAHLWRYVVELLAQDTAILMERVAEDC